ncbi:MAG: c-type cytochrome [Pseudomonadota bacterium]
MLDTMTFTKAAGGICGALLIFLLGQWAAESLYHVEAHGDASFVVEVAGAESTEVEEEEVDFGALLAAADPDAGERQFRKCSACHKVEDGANGAGPHLHGIVGRDIASVGAFGYSETLGGLEGDWTPEKLSGFIEKPSDYAPGTSMGFAGLRDAEDRADLIAYLQTVSN